MNLALDDLEKVEADDKYLVNMGTWHDAKNSVLDKPVCLVCFAGAVMAKTFETDPESTVTAYQFEDIITNALNAEPSDPRVGTKLEALDWIRSGSILNGYRKMREVPWEDVEGILEECGLPTYIRVTKYEENPDKFKEDMRKLSAMLKEYDI